MKRAATLLLLFVVIVGRGSDTAAHAQAEITLDQYRARLASALTALRATDTDPGRSIETALERLGLPVMVSMPDGSTVLITTASLLGGADEGSDAAAAAATADKVQVALDGANASASVVAPDRSQINAALIGAYEGLHAVSPSWTERLLSDFGQVLGWLWDHTVGALARSGAGSLVGWTVVLVLIVIALQLSRRVRRGVVPEARWTAMGDGLTVVDWRRIADEAIAAGDLSAAVPALYHALLGTLVARGVLRDEPSLTAGECRRAVRRTRPALAPSIDDATAAFERVVSGKVPADDEDVAALRDADQVARRS